VQSDKPIGSNREVSAGAVMSGHRRMELTLLCSGREWADKIYLLFPLLKGEIKE